MRICVFQSALVGHQPVEFSHTQDPANFTDEHTFEHVWVRKDTAKEQIDEAIAKQYDFYFNFMWGQHEDEVAGIDACKYFESFDLPSIGQRSVVLERSKNDFYQRAREIGRPRVPGTTNYPLFVKAATSCASMFISPRSLARNREELVASLDNLRYVLAPGRAVASRPEEATADAPVIDGIPIPKDVVVQEYVRGWDYSVVVIEVGGTPVPLAPERYIYPQGFKPYDDFLTFEIKFHPETNVRPIDFEEDPVLFQHLQEVALEAFNANDMQGQSWCNVDIRVPPPGEGEPVAIEVNPMPAVFLPPPQDWEDVSIRKCFPGGHRALINTLIATHLMGRRIRKQAQQRVAEVYDRVSEKYDDNIMKMTKLEEIYDEALATVDISYGTILDLGAGTGLFGRALLQKLQLTPPSKLSSKSSSHKTLAPICPSCSFSLIAIELSQGMIDKCHRMGAYDTIHHGPMQELICSLDLPKIDHIISISALYFLPPVDFSLVMVRTFQLAQKSVVVCIDETPEDYEAKLIEMGPPHSYMVGYNHLAQMDKTFCNPAPPGWSLTKKFRRSAWHSPVTGIEVYATVFCFERV